MSDFALARESIEEVLDFPVQISQFENRAEQRRLKFDKKIAAFKIVTPFLIKTQMQTYRAFLISKYGPLTEFTFTSPFDDIEYTVRFVPNSFKTIYKQGVFQCEFEFEVLDE